MNFGEIWWARLEAPQGSEPGYIRPVLVVQADRFNDSRIQTVVVTVITSNIIRAQAPGNVLITAKQSGLDKDSVVNISQILTIDKNQFLELAGQLPAKVMERVQVGLMLILNIQ